MDDPLPADHGRIDGGRRIPQVASFDPPPVPFPDQDAARVPFLPGERFLHGPDRPDLPGARRVQVTLHGKRPEHVNDDGQAFRLPGAFDQVKNPDIHTAPPPVPVNRPARAERFRLYRRARGPELFWIAKKSLIHGHSTTDQAPAKVTAPGREAGSAKIPEPVFRFRDRDLRSVMPASSAWTALSSGPLPALSAFRC